MKKYIYILLTVFVTAALFSCEEDKNTIPPTFKGFLVSPKPCHPGDTVRVKLYYADKGEYVYGPRCAWSLKIDTLMEDGLSNDTTYWKYISASIADEHLGASFILPKSTKPGNYTCNLEVSFNNSVDSKQAIVRENTVIAPYEGHLGKSIVSSLLYSKFSGSVNIRVE